MKKQWWQQCRCGLIQPEYGPIEGVEFSSEAVDKQDERSQTDEIKMNGQGSSKSANQNKDSGQQIEEPDDFKEETLSFQPGLSSGNIQRLLNDAIGAANRVNGRRLPDIIKDPGDIAIAFDFFTVDLNDPSIAGASRDDLLANIVFSMSRTAIKDVVVGGQQVVEDGRHTDQDEITNKFNDLQARLWN